MKILKVIGVFSVFALSAFSPAASAATEYMRVKVPFSFVVAGEHFAPGEYVVSQSETGVIRVQGAGKAAMVISTPAAAPTGAASSLRFTHNQQQLYLTTVAQQGEVSRGIPLRSVAQRAVSMSSH